MSSSFAAADFSTGTHCSRAITLASGLSLHVVGHDTHPAYACMPTVMLLHGLGDAAVVWHDVAALLGMRARVIAPDLRGHGDSSWPAGADYRIASLAADVAELIDTLGLPALTLVGHSMGAAVALRIACEQPERIERLVLADMGLDADPTNAAQLRQALRDAHRLYPSSADYEAVLRARHPLASPALLQRVAAQTSIRRAHGQFEAKYDKRVLDARERTAQQAGQLAYHDAWQQLAALSCPLLVLRGAASSVLSKRVAQRISDTPRHGTFVPIPLAGHSVQLDNPAAVTQAIAQFMQTDDM
jgi:esterase